MSSFTTTFSVRPLTCPSCISPLHSTLLSLPGLTTVSIDPTNQLVTTTGTTPPSTIVAALQSLGKDAILRGTGSGFGSGSGGAAVCILETNGTGGPGGLKVKGLARMVQVAGLMGEKRSARTLVDLTIRGAGKGEGLYRVTVRQRGDISCGAASMGGVWGSTEKKVVPPDRWPGYLGSVEIGKEGAGSAFLDCAFAVSEVIGRGMVVSRAETETEGDAFEQDDEDTLVGVIARSAGVWENEKTVCSCSGKTVWEEREEQVAKGMV